MLSKQKTLGLTNVGPRIENYTFDLNEGIITLTFSESINTSSVIFERFVLLSSDGDDPVKHQFTNGSTPTTIGKYL